MILQINQTDLESFLKTSLFEFTASQKAISFPIIKRIHRRLQNGHIFSPIKVLNGVIIDGHHRYISLKLLGLKVEHTTAGENYIIAKMLLWNRVDLDPNDYDTIEEIIIYKERYG